MLFKFINDKRVSRLKLRLKREQEKAALFERKYIEERNKRMELEKKSLTKQEKLYIRSLIHLGKVVNSHKHIFQGLYSQLNIELLDFTDQLLRKLSDD
jgi:hypothetical protein